MESTAKMLMQECMESDLHEIIEELRMLPESMFGVMGVTRGEMLMQARIMAGKITETENGYV